MVKHRTDILMYHSISQDQGPTSIPENVFASQMGAIAAAKVPVISMDEVVQRLRANSDAPYGIAITFDDGFEDFASAAWPILKSYGFCPMVYLPCGHVGQVEKWDDCNSPPRKLMGWDTISGLADEGVQFGSHTASHPDLTKLAPAELETEISKPCETIEAHLSKPIEHFAPPYGYSNSTVRNMISQTYKSSVGTNLGTASSTSDIFDLPRLEMHYYVDAKRWNDHLSGRGASYLARRKLLRKVRRILLPG